MDWRRVAFTEHMTEAAAVEATCHVVFDFGGGERATYEISVFQVLKGTGAPYFATGTNRDQPDAFRPMPAIEPMWTCCSKGVDRRRMPRPLKRGFVRRPVMRR